MLKHEFEELLGREARPYEYGICNAVYEEIPDISKQAFVGKYLNNTEDLLDYLLKALNTQRELKRIVLNGLRKLCSLVTRLYFIDKLCSKEDFDECMDVFNDCLGVKQARSIIISVLLSQYDFLSSDDVVDILRCYMNSEQ